MDKAINLQAKLHVGSDPTAIADLQQSLPSRFGADNPGLTLTVKHVSPPDDKGDVTVRIYIEGAQDPAADFAALTRGALHKTIASMNADAANGAAPSSQSAASAHVTPQSGMHIKDLQETEGDDENTGVTLAPYLRAQATSPAPAPAAPAPAATPTQPAAPASTQSQTPPPSTAQASDRSQWWAFWKRRG